MTEISICTCTRQPRLDLHEQFMWRVWCLSCGQSGAWVSTAEQAVSNWNRDMKEKQLEMAR